jgi:hypothetical protein
MISCGSANSRPPGVVHVDVPAPYALVPAIHVARQIAEKGSHLGVRAAAGHEVLDVAAIPGGVVSATDQPDVLAGHAPGYGVTVSVGATWAVTSERWCPLRCPCSTSDSPIASSASR